MQYFITMCCANLKCINRGHRVVVEVISQEAAINTLRELQEEGPPQKCPDCQKFWSYFLKYEEKQEPCILQYIK